MASGKKYMSSRERGSCPDQLRSRRSYADAHRSWIQSKLSGEDRLVQPTIEWKAIREISSVQLHGEVGVPVLETSCDKAVATIDLLQDILIPIRVRPTSVIMEQDIPTMELGAIIDERRAQVSHRVHAVQEEAGLHDVMLSL